MPDSLLLTAGAQPAKPTKYAPISVKRFFSGLYTNRSPFNAPGDGTNTRYYDRMLGGRPDALIDGLNTEITCTNTIIRRPGFSVFSASIPPVTAFHSFHRLDGSVVPLADTSTAVFSLAQGTATSIFTKSSGAGQTTLQGVGNRLFMGDGIDLVKWDGTTITKWGIAAPATAPALTFSTGTASITATWSYTYCYKSSTTQHVSTAAPISASTGKQTNIAVGLTGAGSADPQADLIQIYRTTDGGAYYLLLAEIPNPGAVNWSYADTSTDAALNEFVIAPQAHVNDPPPAGLVNLVYHAGRLWGSVGNTVYYAAGPDTTVGSGLESWPPANYFTFPSRVVRMVPYSNGLLVFTVDAIYAIWGTVSAVGAYTGSGTMFYAKVFQDGLGLLSYNALDVLGSDIFLFSSDRQFVNLNPSAGIVESGFPIADILDGLAPAKVYVAAHISGHRDKAVYLSDGNTTLYRCAVSQPPEGGPAWSPPAVPVGGCRAIGSVETSPGVHRLAISCSTSGPVLVRDVNSFTDAGAAYSSTATLGSWVLAQPGQLAEVQSLTTEIVANGLQPGIGILANEIDGDFQALTEYVPDPPDLAPSTSVISNRFYLAQGAQPIEMRHMQIQIDFGVDTVRNELLSLTLYGSVHGE